MSAGALRRDWRARGHAGWWAFAVHRMSGIALAIFLPMHFWFLARALGGAAALDEALRWTEAPLVKASEIGVVFLLAAHLTGGLRLLLIEFAGWKASWQPALLAVAGAVAAGYALLFALELL